MDVKDLVQIISDTEMKVMLLGQQPTFLSAESRLRTDSLSASPGQESNSDVAAGLPEYVDATFRVLSKALIPGYVLDFTEGTVLKDAVPLYDGRPVSTNHRKQTEELIGSVLNPVWDEKSFGVPGINAILRVQSALGPRVVQQLISDPPVLRNVSTGLHFEWQPSHTFKRMWEFWDRLGEEVEGSIVRILVKKIISIHEVSFVFQGADPNAQGLVTNFKTACLEACQSLPKSYQLTGGTDVMNVTKTPPQPAELAARIEALEIEKIALSDKIAELEPLAAAGKAHLTSLREEIKRLGKIALGDNWMDEMLISSDDAAALEKQRKNFARLADEKIPMTCQSCGSSNLQRRSSVETPGEEGLAVDDKPAERKLSKAEEAARSKFGCKED